MRKPPPDGMMYHYKHIRSLQQNTHRLLITTTLNLLILLHLYLNVSPKNQIFEVFLFWDSLPDIIYIYCKRFGLSALYVGTGIIFPVIVCYKPVGLQKWKFICYFLCMLTKMYIHIFCMQEELLI